MAVGIALLIAAGSATVLVNPIPPAAAPVTETRNGIATTDPYRWMEEPARAADLTAFVRAASDLSVKQLAALPRHAEFTRVLEAASSAGVRFFDVRSVGDRLVYRRLDPTDRVPRLMVRDGTGERLLFDPSAGGVNAAIGDWSVSPDGKTVALHVSGKGSEQGEVRFLEVATGRAVRAPIAPVWGEFEAAWLTPTRFAVTRMVPSAADPMQGMRAYVGDLVNDDDIPVFGSGIAGALVSPSEFPIIDATADSDWVLGIAGNARVDQRFFVTRRDRLAAGKPDWRRFADLDDRVSSVSLLGDEAWVITSKGASNGRLERRDLKTGKTAVVNLPAGLVLTEVLAARDGVYVTAQSDGAARLLFVPPGSTQAQVAALPFEADFTRVHLRERAPGIVFTLMGWTTAQRSFQAVGGVVSSVGLDSVGWTPAKDFVVQRHEAVSRDGTRVPLVVVAPPGGKGPRPTILEAYGSYGAPSTTPWYQPYLLAWTGSGGAMAYCGVRGGNERGRDWHEGGRAGNKPNAHADYIACAEKLVALGTARPGGIGATGTSAGGMLAPIAVQQRPELFGALLPRVAILNASRLEAAENGANQYSEMGDPATPEGYRALVGADATLALATAKGLPDTLVTIGLNDKRVAPWMGAKYAATALQRFGDKTSVLVRADAEAGHGVGSTRQVQVAEWADAFAFIADRLAR